MPPRAPVYFCRFPPAGTEVGVPAGLVEVLVGGLVEVTADFEPSLASRSRKRFWEEPLPGGVDLLVVVGAAEEAALLVVVGLGEVTAWLVVEGLAEVAAWEVAVGLADEELELGRTATAEEDEALVEVELGAGAGAGAAPAPPGKYGLTAAATKALSVFPFGMAERT